MCLARSVFPVFSPVTLRNTACEVGGIVSILKAKKLRLLRYEAERSNNQEVGQQHWNLAQTQRLFTLALGQQVSASIMLRNHFVFPEQLSSVLPSKA